LSRRLTHQQVDVFPASQIAASRLGERVAQSVEPSLELTVIDGIDERIENLVLEIEVVVDRPRIMSSSPTTSSNRLIFASSTCMTRCSMVPRQTRLVSVTSCSCPTRCSRPSRCSICIGFHGRSKFTITWQNWRLRPSPADSVESRIGVSARNVAIADSFSARVRLP